MAEYHLTTKHISRSSGRSSTAAASYRAGVAIYDERTGLTHDYSKRNGVIMSVIQTKTGYILLENNKITDQLFKQTLNIE